MPHFERIWTEDMNKASDRIELREGGGEEKSTKDRRALRNAGSRKKAKRAKRGNSPCCQSGKEIGTKKGR